MRMLKVTLATAAVIAAIAGCGGGGGGPNEIPLQTVSGAAATGAPMSGTAFLKDSGNNEMSTTINPQTGGFAFNVLGKTPPYMLRAGSYYSMASGPGTANINPATTLIVAQMGAFTNMSSMNSFYQSPNATKMSTMMSNQGAATQQYQQTMAPLLSQYGATSMDPMNGPYTIGQGYDRMFDDVKMSIDASGNVTMMYANGTPVFTGHMGNMSGGTMMTGNIMPPGMGSATGITISPSTAKLQVNGNQQFAASIPVTWSVVTVNGGTITSGGLYTAPASAGMYMIRATSQADPAKSATLMVQVGNRGMMM